MIQKKSLVASAMSLALSSMMLSASLNAGVIDNSNPTTGSFLGACGNDDLSTADVDESKTTACIGAWNLDNVDVKLVKADDINTVFGTFTAGTGAYSAMTYGDSFRSYVKDVTGTYMARVSGKDWPVGEPTGIKAVINDPGVKNGNPANCIINTSYLDGAADSDTATSPDPALKQTSYLDTDHPEPVICSSGFQTHKRFKIAMLDTTVAGVDAGKPGKPVDLVFNVADDASGLRSYQVFSKINNYTGMRLKGYMIQVGKGVGDAFQTASELGIADRLKLSRGIGDNSKDGSNLWKDDQMATFSSGLFGLADDKFPSDGFFDNQPAGFLVGEGCTSSSAPNLDIAVSTCSNSDTLYSTGPLNVDTTDGLDTKDSFYYAYFGNWVHQTLTPRGIFFDTDGDPTTDAELVAYWDGTQWVKPDNLGTVAASDGTPSTFVPVSETELNTWANDRNCYENTKSCYTVDVIEDVLNLGLNYVVKVGDAIGAVALGGNTITVRIIPVVADNPTEGGSWYANLPAVGDLTSTSVPASVITSSSGGGCTIGSNGRFDPTLPALVAAGLGFFGWRRFKSGK